MTIDLPDDVEPDAAKFLDGIDNVAPGKNNRRRRDGAVGKISVEAVALGDTRQINPDAAPSRGLVVGRISNRNLVVKERGYNFHPYAIAEYYLWVDAMPRETKTRLTILRVPSVGGRVTAVHQERLTLCHPRKAGVAAVSEVDFVQHKHASGTKCWPVQKDEVTVARASLFSLAPLTAFASRVSVLLGGGEINQLGRGGRPPAIYGEIWIECNSGCCT
ncbi:MAG TPA: hypothetical protein VNO75_01075 [Gemmatimonadaceae bacterium]|nr:hypothetical protein [Gemmatimonadaceae bacterium]